MKDFSLADIRIFTKSVELGGLTQAASLLRVPKASASRQLQRLEAAVGHVLLHRGGTRFSLTKEGHEFLPIAQNVLETLDEIVSSLTGENGALTGRLRIGTPNYLGREVLMPHLARFMAIYPNLEIAVESGNEAIDLFRDEADVTIRCGREGCDELVARHLKYEPMILCATPAYLKLAPKIEEVQNLTFHFFLVAETGTPKQETLTIGSEFLRGLHSDRVFRSNDFEILMELVLSSLGVALIPAILVKKQIEENLLVQVLPDLKLPALEINLVYLPKRRKSPKIRAFVDFLLDAYKNS